jgi:Transposase DDE domain
VGARSRFAAAENRSPCPAQRPGGPNPGHPRPVAPLQKREGLLALRFFAAAPLLPQVVLPGSAQSAHPSPGAPAARFAAGLRPRTRLSFGRLSSDGHDPRSGPGEGEGFSQGALLCGQATFGRSASKSEWVYGFKAALVVDPEGVITAFGLAPAASDERPIGEALLACDRYGAYLADKGFTGLEWERHWMEIYGALVAATPKNDSRRAWSKADRRWASGKRQIIEGVIGQLKDIFALERQRAKTLGGLLTRLAAKVAAYTCAQRINDSLGRPLRHLADLLV